jgi:hypothetical protein
LYTRDQECIHNQPVEIRKQSALNEAEDPDPEFIERTRIVLNSTEEILVTESVIKQSADSYCSEQRAAADGQKITTVIVILL